MCAGTHADVVAELPVVEVVATAPSGARVRRNLVVLVAVRRELLLAIELHLPGRVRVGQRRRAMVEDGAGLERQLVVRDVRGLQCQRRVEIGECLLQRLCGQAVHEIEIEVLEASAADFIDRSRDVAAAVNAAERTQMIGIESLRAERDAIDSGSAIAAEPAMLDGARIFRASPDVRCELHQRASSCEEAPDLVGREQARRAAAKEYRDERAPLRSAGIDRKILDQRVDVLLLRNRLGRHVRVEIAVRALAHAPRHVHVQRERWQCVHRTSLRNCATRPRNACPR